MYKHKQTADILKYVNKQLTFLLIYKQTADIIKVRKQTADIVFKI